MRISGKLVDRQIDSRFLDIELASGVKKAFNDFSNDIDSDDSKSIKIESYWKFWNKIVERFLKDVYTHRCIDRYIDE